jgi:tetratricopeptide (TPR) repeat protein
MRTTPPSSQSWLDNCRHLLRHLHDPVGLRRNPIFTTYFLTGPADRSSLRAAMLAAQQAVRSAAEALRTRTDVNGVVNSHYRRQSVILTRCDLGREPRASVARDLALSRSYYFRERHNACVFVSDFLRAYLTHRGSEETAIVDRVQSEFDRIDALFHAGEVPLAVTRLEEFISGTHDRVTRVVGYCTLVGFLAYVDRLREARLALQAAAECYSAILDAATSTPQSVRDCRIRYLVARGSLTASMDMRSAQADLDEAIASFRHTKAWTDGSMAKVLVSASVQQVHLALILGDLTSAERAMACAEAMVDDVLDDTLHATIVERSDYFCARAGLLLHKGALGSAIAVLRDGLRLTRGRLFPHQTTNLLICMSRAFEYGGDGRAALRVLQWCRGIAPSMAADSYPVRAVNLRLGESVSPSSRRNVSAPEVAQGGSEMTYLSVASSLNRAQTLVRDRRHGAALQVLGEAGSVADRLGYQKEALRSMLLQAEAMVASSRRDEAATILDAALTRAEALRSPHWLRRSLATSAALTGNRDHASSAEVLLQDLRSRLTEGIDGGFTDLMECEERDLFAALEPAPSMAIGVTLTDRKPKGARVLPTSRRV